VADSASPTLTAQPLETGMPSGTDPRRLLRRGLEAAALLAALVAVVVLAPGLGDVRRHLDHANAGWLGLAIGLEALSCCSYALIFRPVFCSRMSWRTTWEISWAELGMGSIVPASGLGGLALGAWILRRGGMPAEQIARRSVAFFLVKGSVNFVAVAVVGALLAVGAIGPHQSLWLTAVPAVLALAAIVGVALLGRLGEPEPPAPGAARARRWWTHSRRALVGGVRETVALLRRGERALLVGIVGYWIFDNAVLWATYHAVGSSPAISVILIGYLIGQLGGLLPIPGGIGGIDGGLVGTLVVYGAPAGATAAAVIAYRVILFWLPLLVGAFTFWSLRRGLDRPDRADLCYTPAAA
jgi:uncharacterized membrane protein YbhN (UPF0104 family)